MQADLNERIKHWKDRLHQLQRYVWPEPQEPNHLYHYSSAKNIRNILASGELWLFDVRSMQNDPGDGLYWMEVFWRVLNRKSVPDWLREHFRPGRTLGLAACV
jgi:hypothetical protein